MQDYVLENLIKSFSHRSRIATIEALHDCADLSVSQLSSQLSIDYKTTSGHVRRLAVAGLVTKSYDGREVEHRLTPQGEKVYEFLQTLK